ncbi:hypothetical protein K8R47_03890 [archaeon]|nr:hypothetical protein [archaeon]
MKKFAEFIGIMLGDGYFVDDRIKISFNSKDDLDYIEYVKDLINNIFDVNPILKFRKNENTADLFVFKRNVIKILKEKGLLKSPKWNNAIIPKSFLKYDLHVLRGYFDTDGCVVMAMNNGTFYPRLEMKICPSPMQKQFIAIISKYKFRFGVYDIGKGKVRIQLNGKEQLKKWFNLVGFSNSKHMIKAKKFLK